MDWNYIAGYFDADGNLHVTFNSRSTSFQTLFRIYSTNLDVLTKIKNFTGFGRIYLKKKESKMRCACYEYTLGKKEDVEIVLKKINLYLIVKKIQVDYLLSNFDFKRGYSNHGFNLEEFRRPITRKNVGKQRRNYIEERKVKRKLHTKEWGSSNISKEEKKSRSPINY